jgi:hypothetical protein
MGSSKTGGKRFSDPLAEEEAQSQGDAQRSIQGDAAEIYGTTDIQTKPSPTRITMVNIFEIYPDRTQPRRVIPTEIREAWDGHTQTLPALFDHWLKQAESEKGESIDIRALLGRVETTPISEQFTEDTVTMGPLEAALVSLSQLAADIRQNGLTNPISAVRGDGYHILETGERRWLAFHLLNAAYGGETDKWSKIPTRVMEAFSRWRQASENNTRSDLNAIGKARQLALLLMDLLGKEYDFRTIDDFTNELEFYRQVADGNTYRVPRGRGEDVVQAMGLKSPDQIRQYRELLRLPLQIWQLADDRNLALRTLREIMREAGDDVQLAVNLLLDQDDEDDTVSALTVSPVIIPPPIEQLTPDMIANTLPREERGVQLRPAATKYKALKHTYSIRDKAKMIAKRKPIDRQEAELILQTIEEAEEHIARIKAVAKEVLSA